MTNNEKIWRVLISTTDKLEDEMNELANKGYKAYRTTYNYKNDNWIMLFYNSEIVISKEKTDNGDD